MSSDVTKAGFSNVQQALQAVARQLSTLADEETPAVFEFFDTLAKMSEEQHQRVKDRLLLYLNVYGQQATAKGTMRCDVGGYEVQAIPTRTGVDAKKLEALLRARGIPVTDAMAEAKTYKVDAAKVAELVAMGKLSPDDLTRCGPDKSYRVSVKRIEEPEAKQTMRVIEGGLAHE